MTIRLGVVMGPIEHVTYKKDSTLAMLWAAAERNWEISYMTTADLYISGGQARSSAQALRVFKDPAHFYELDSRVDIALGDLDVILMRKRPAV